MTVVQRIYNTDGSYTDRPTSIAQQYAGDGHDHWHSLNMEGGALVHVDTGRHRGRAGKARVLLLRQRQVPADAAGCTGHRPVHPGQQLCVR